MNSVNMIGRLVKDPELQKTRNGISYTRFTIAINGFSDDDTNFVPVIAWKGIADFITSYAKKGNLLSVSGRFNSSTYEKDNKKVTRYEVVAERAAILTKNENSQEVKKDSPKEIEIPWEEPEPPLETKVTQEEIQTFDNLGL